MTECRDGLHKKEDCQWGDWLLANFNQNAGGRGEGRDARTRGGMAWCGRGRGSGRNNGKEVDTEDMEVYEEDVDGSNRDSLRRKRDVSESGNSGTVVGKVQLLENGPARPPVSP